ncbi:hypothetical protein [Chryseobacterium sp. c4a]|uniref:hypothetical protein n=1 Tax=Chryseobacterium sp. c4a TaxID=1573582 RepID=UPI001E41E675|nr:hypothetical protein [Chryseobacterium sp. c4a]
MMWYRNLLTVIGLLLISLLSAQSCNFDDFVNDLSQGNAVFKSIVNEEDGFKAWQILAEEAPALRKNADELNLVSKNLSAIEKAGGYKKWKEADGLGSVFGNIAKNGNKIEYTNPAGKILRWSEQRSNDINNSIINSKNLDISNSNNVGRIIEGKVGDFVNGKKQVTAFGQKIDPNITDIDVGTADEIIEVKASFSSVKETQFAKLLNKDLDNFCNPYNKKVILYIDKPLSDATPAQINMIDRIKQQGVTVVNSLEELGQILK